MGIFLSKLILMIFFLNHLNANNWALPCAGCHSPTGIYSKSTIPSIYDLDKKYFINALKDYKSGVRDNYIMQIISRGYTDQEIEMLADYYAKKD